MKKMWSKIPWETIGFRIGYGVAWIWNKIVLYQKIVVAVAIGAGVGILAGMWWLAPKETPKAAPHISEWTFWPLVWWTIACLGVIFAGILDRVGLKKTARTLLYTEEAIVLLYALPKVLPQTINWFASHQKYIVWTGWAMGGLTLLALIIVVVRWWRNRPASTTPAIPGTTLSIPKAKMGERLKKVLETGIALGKLTSLLAITGVLFVFIVGPTKFWGQPMVVQQVPAAQGVAGGIRTQAGATPDPKRIDILAPVGTLETPLGEWGGPLHLSGRRSQMDAFANDGTRREGILAVNADGVIHIIGPGLDPDIGKPNMLWFLSFTNFPLKVSGRIE